ncbi:uncharacterized protein [Coffea arabica]|uniref:Uncharacterized protein isoform X1 n=1 Tax=Coffea arabica TaxID=13443 RepID=A0A6P6VWS4_COFAR|nr:uncharacterized protein LOC113726658 isoform X1 [Coffea arabica]
MSLSLLQGYSSEEEEEEEEKAEEYDYYDSDDGGKRRNDQVSDNRYKPLFDPNPSSSSFLPSAFDAFSEVSGPPEFLNNSVEEAAKDDDGQKRRHCRRRNRRDKSDLPVGAVVEAKAQLVGIHERVRSDFEGNIPRTSPSHSAEDAKRTTFASNLNENAAELMRMCLTCGMVKTYSGAKGMVCPVCGDESMKKKGSTIKDKEKLKRMKGQSSHASWKSETEMQLRQQFD